MAQMVVVKHERAQVFIAKYVCRKCGAEDFAKLFEHEKPAPAMNCWNCHSGLHQDVEKMLTKGLGMAVVSLGPRDDDSDEPGATLPLAN